MNEPATAAWEEWFRLVFWLVVGFLAGFAAVSREPDADDLAGVDRWCYDRGAHTDTALRECIWDFGDIYADLHPEVPRGR